MKARSKKNAVIHVKHCVACGSCVTVCPLSAISINQGSFAQVDEDKCVGCGRCSNACPASVIKVEVRQ